MHGLKISLLGAIVVGSLHASAASGQVAQAGAAQRGSCLRTPGAVGAVSRCALSLRQNVLRQGGVIVDRGRLFHRIELLSFVTGDSAVKYATLFERNDRWGAEIAFAGMGAYTASLIATKGCHSVFCGGDSPRRGVKVAAFGSIGLLASSVVVRLYGKRAANKAIGFYNSTLAP